MGAQILRVDRGAGFSVTVYSVEANITITPPTTIAALRCTYTVQIADAAR
jgi:hypothetical protein